MRKSRIIFVGIHNKAGKEPLCSSTKTGKIVDEIAEQFAINDHEVVKTNLYNIDSMPEGATHAAILVADFFYRNKFAENDIVVLLGKDVQTVIPVMHTVSLLKLNHPSSVFGTEKRQAYIQQAIQSINDRMLPY